MIQPHTLHRITDRIIALAQAYHLTRGYRLRVDSSVTESNIHHPTDSALLDDGVRLLSRWLKRARLLLPARSTGARLCQSHNRRARRRMQQIARWPRAHRNAKHDPAKKKPHIERILNF